MWLEDWNRAEQCEQKSWMAHWMYWLGLQTIIAGLMDITSMLEPKQGTSKCYIWEQYDKRNRTLFTSRLYGRYTTFPYLILGHLV
jgi:hypothetical protein